MLTSLLSETPEIYQVIILAVAALVLGGIFGLVYSLFKKKDGYYKDMVISYTLFPFLVTVACIGVTVLTSQFDGDQLTARFGRVAVALLAAVLVLRFRSEQRNFEDLTYMFFLTILGLLLGTGYIFFAALVYVLVIAVMAAFHFLKFPRADQNSLVLKVTVPEDLNYPDAFEDIFNEYTINHKLVKTKTADLGSVFILEYNITMNKGASQKDFVDKIRTRNSNLNIVLATNEFKEYK